MTKSPANRPKQAGLTLLEVMVSLAIIGMASIGVAQLTDRYTTDVRNTITSDKLRRNGDAAKAYVKDNYAAISAVATATSPFLVTNTMLVSGGYLPTGTTAVNDYNQTACTLVLQPSANKLQGLVVTEGGTTVDDITLGAIVALAGGSAGAVRTATPTQVLGTLGGWSFATATYHNRVNNAGTKCDGTAGAVQLTAGHPAYALWFENGDYQSATLYRDAVPGRPELNTINTPLILNSPQTVGAACTLTGALANDGTGAVVSCNGGTWKSVGGSAFWGDPVTNFASLGSCTAANLGATRIARTPTVGTGPRAYTCDGAIWRALAVDDSGNLVVGNTATGAAISGSATGSIAVGTVEIKKQVTLGAACTPNGSVGADAYGLLLSCQTGIWAGLSSGMQGKIDVLTVSGSYVIPGDAVKVTVVGGGGGGGNALTGDIGGVGGGGGGAAIKFIRGQKGTVYNVIIAAAAGANLNGNTTWFGAGVYATGGLGGVTNYGNPGGYGGFGYGGDLNLGGSGGNGFSYAPTSRRFSGGFGGASILGGGAAGSGNNGAIVHGNGFGAGGAGGSNGVGGTGAQGVVLVEY